MGGTARAGEVTANPSAPISRPSRSLVKSRSPVANRCTVRLSSPAAIAIWRIGLPSAAIAARMMAGSGCILIPVTIKEVRFQLGQLAMICSASLAA
jgi:hypothetical protein